MDLAVRLGRQRLELGDRLDTQERGDASQVVAWGLLQLGRLDEALAVVQAMHERFGPGQGVWLRLVARAWETSARRSLGQWDEALAAARRMAELWDEYERSSAGFAVHGFLTALEIARARLDERGVRDFTAMSGELIRLFEPARRQARLIALVDDDPEAVSARIVSYWREFAGRLDQVEIALAFLADRGGHVDEREVTELAETARRFDLLLVEAQAHRALGVARSDPDELRLAVEQFERMGAQGSLGYARADLGLLTGDEVLLELGTARLKALGAVAQLDRLAARRRSNRPVAPSGS